MMVHDDGQGMGDQPIMVNGELAIFQIEDGSFEIIQQGGEKVKQRIPANVSEEFWNELKSIGWKTIEEIDLEKKM